MGELVEWNINGTTYTEKTVPLEIAKTSEPQTISVSIEVSGPGGSFTKTLEGEEAVIVSPIFVPLFQSGS